MADIAEIGFKAETKPLVDAKTALNDLTPATGKAEAGVNRLNAVFEKGRGAALRFMQGLTGIVKGAAGVLTSTFGQIVSGFAAAFSAEALLSRLTETAHGLDDVSKAARAVGSSVQSMQALQIAGALAGVSTDLVASATRRMNRVLGDAIAKGTGTKGVFERLGISAKALAALPIDQRFATIADQMQKLHFSTSDTTAALAALGDRGGQLVGLLGEGGEQIRKASDDVAKFGLALTNVQGKNIEDMNDNFSRLGFSIQGAFNQFIATIAPALSAVFGGVATGIAWIVKNIGILTPALQFVGTVFAVAFGPVVIASVWALAGAIIDGAVGAVFALTAAIAANPLGALAIAVVSIISAVWTFRDAIKTTFGIDVVAIAKDTANWLIRAFMTAYTTVEDIWNNFPKVLGSAAIGAANAAIDGLNSLIQKSIDGINTLINAIPTQIRFGVQPIASGTGLLGRMDDPYAQTNAATAKAYQDKLATINQTDYVNNLTTAYTKLSAATDTSKIATDGLTGSVGGLGSSLDGISAPDGAAAKAKGGIDSVKTAAQQAMETLIQFRSDLQDAFSGAFKSFLGDLKQGKSLTDSLTDALGSLGDKLLDMVENNVLSGLFGALMPGGSGGGLWNIPSAFTPGGFFPGLASQALGGGWYRGTQFFAQGGVVGGPTAFGTGSGLGVMGEAGPEAVMPLHRAANGSLGVMVAANQNEGRPAFQLNVMIQNNASNDVEASATIGDDGTLLLKIDKMNARLVSDPASNTNKAIGRSFGVRNAVVQR